MKRCKITYSVFSCTQSGLASIKRQKEEAKTKMERKVEEERVTGRRGG